MGEFPKPRQINRAANGEEVAENAIPGELRPREEEISDPKIEEGHQFGEIKNGRDTEREENELRRDVGKDRAYRERSRGHPPSRKYQAAGEEQEPRADVRAIGDIITPREAAGNMFHRAQENSNRNTTERQAESQEMVAAILPPQNEEYDCDDRVCGASA